MKIGPTVFVVDDDPGVLDCVRGLAGSVKLNVETFQSAEEFLAAYKPDREGCVVVDVRMPGMDGLELQKKLVDSDYSIPVIMLSGFGDVAMAVRAMKAGAISFLEKPVNEQLLLDTIREAIASDSCIRRDKAEAREILARIARLTPRERQVMELLVAGKLNKEVAAKLQLSEKTIEIHRAHVMEKLQAESIADLVRLALRAGVTKGNS